MPACTHRGGAHRQRVSTFWLGKTLTNFSCAPDGIRTSGHGIHSISRPTLYQLSHHVPRWQGLKSLMSSTPNLDHGWRGLKWFMLNTPNLDRESHGMKRFMHTKSGPCVTWNEAIHAHQILTVSHMEWSDSCTPNLDCGSLGLKWLCQGKHTRSRLWVTGVEMNNDSFRSAS